MFDTSKIIGDLQQLIDQALAADAVTDAGEIAMRKADFAQQLAATLAADAAQNAAVLKAKDDEIAALKVRIALLETPPDYVPPPPPSTGFPDASNTGVPTGTALVNSGGMTVTVAGTVIEGKNFTGRLNINANNVTVRKCSFSFGDFRNILIKDGTTGTVIEDCFIDNKKSGGQGIHGVATIRRCKIINCGDCIDIPWAGGLVEDNYLHVDGPSDAHFDCMQIGGNNSNLVIRHNTMVNEQGQTSCIMIGNDFGSVNGVLVDNNRLLGGGYTVYSARGTSGPSIQGVKFTNNRMKKGYYGYASIQNNSVVWTGNVDDATGAPINA